MALLDDDGRSVHSEVSRKTQSTAGFSLATRLPPGSYQGGTDYYRDTSHARGPSKSTLNAFPNLPYGGGPGSIVGGGNGSEFGYPGGFHPPVFNRQSHMSLGSMGPPMSAMGMPQRDSTMSFAPPQMPHLPQRDSNMSFGYGGMPQTNSVYSMNPFMTQAAVAATVSENANPSEEELVAALKYVAFPPSALKL